MTHDEIFTKVRTTLVDALSVDDEQVTPTARLKGDLGAESIDFLDIVFRLEKQFGVTIPREELFPESIFQGDAKFVANGKVGQGRRPVHRRVDRPLPGIQGRREEVISCQ
jgi:acyl carrier protein